MNTDTIYHIQYSYFYQNVPGNWVKQDVYVNGDAELIAYLDILSGTITAGTAILHKVEKIETP